MYHFSSTPILVSDCPPFWYNFVLLMFCYRWSAFVVIKVLSASPSHLVGWSTSWPNEAMSVSLIAAQTAPILVSEGPLFCPSLICCLFRNLPMINVPIACMSEGPTSADLSNTEESRHRPTSAGLSNIEESKRRLGYQLHKIGYTLCATTNSPPRSQSARKVRFCFVFVFFSFPLPPAPPY